MQALFKRLPAEITCQHTHERIRATSDAILLKRIKKEKDVAMYTSRSDEILLIANDNLHLIYIFATLRSLLKNPNVVYT